MKVEKAELLVTLRTADGTFRKGKIFTAPGIPASIIREIRANTGTIKVYDVQVHETPSIHIPESSENMMEPPATEDNFVAGGNIDVAEVLEDSPASEETPEETEPIDTPKVIKRKPVKRK